MLQINKGVDISAATIDDVEISANPIGLTKSDLLKSVEKEALIKHLVNLYKEKLILEIKGPDYMDTYSRLLSYCKDCSGVFYKDDPVVLQYPDFFTLDVGIGDRVFLNKPGVSIVDLKNFLVTKLEKELL